MYVSSNGGRILHRRNCRLCKTVKRATQVFTQEQIANLPRCRVCRPDVRESFCLVCYEPDDESGDETDNETDESGDDTIAHLIDCPCTRHRICKPCLQRHVQLVCAEVPSDALRLRQGSIPCPCGTGEFDVQRFDAHLFGTWRRAVCTHTRDTRAAPSTDDNVQSLLENLTLKCPKCHAAFYDFDGCIALQCRCGAFFCALCMQMCDSSDACHDHILRCDHNAHRSYYVPMDEWHDIVTQQKTQRVLTFFETCCMKSQLHALSTWFHVRHELTARNISIVPTQFLSLWRLLGEIVRGIIVPS